MLSSTRRTISKTKTNVMGFDATTTMLITLATGGPTVEVVPAAVVVVAAVLSAMSSDGEDGELREWKTCFGRQQKK